MLSFNQTFDDTRNIKILVVPIGNNSLFEAQYKAVSKLKDIPFYELSRPVQRNNNPPFKFMNWSDGNILFDYLRYDRVPRGAGDLDNLQSSKRILMIIGVINYPELGEAINNLEEEMNYFSKRYPHVVLRRLFVFNSFESDLTAAPTTPAASPLTLLRGLSDDPNSLVIFPPDGICEGGSMIDVHLQEVMCNAAVKLILSLERQMDFAEECRTKNIMPNGLALFTPYDDVDEIATLTNSAKSAGGGLGRGGAGGGAGATGGTAGGLLSGLRATANPASIKPQQLYKKKPAGRIRKWMGDLCLQVCSPIDAIEQFIPAIIDCRALGDSLWLAGALDGYATAVLLLLQHVANGSSINIDDIIGKDLKTITLPVSASQVEGGVSSLDTMSPEEKAYRLVEERTNEAIAIYSRNIVFCTMEVECTLRLARLYEKSSPALSRLLIPNRELIVLEYVMRASSVPGLHAHQQLVCTLEGALIFQRLGMRKKYALFLYIAALMCAENDNYTVAQALIHYALLEYGIVSGTFPDNASIYSTLQCIYDKNTQNVVEVEQLPSVDQVLVEDADASWASMRLMLLTNGVLICKENNDNITAARLLAALLRLVSTLESDHSKIRDKWLHCTQKYFGMETFQPTGNSPTPLAATNNSTAAPAGAIVSPQVDRHHSRVLSHDIGSSTNTSTRDPPSTTTAATGGGAASPSLTLTEESLRKLQLAAAGASMKPLDHPGVMFHPDGSLITPEERLQQQQQQQQTSVSTATASPAALALQQQHQHMLLHRSPRTLPSEMSYHSSYQLSTSMNDVFADGNNSTFSGRKPFFGRNDSNSSSTSASTATAPFRSPTLRHLQERRLQFEDSLGDSTNYEVGNSNREGGVSGSSSIAAAATVGGVAASRKFSVPKMPSSLIALLNTYNTERDDVTSVAATEVTMRQSTGSVVGGNSSSNHGGATATSAGGSGSEVKTERKRERMRDRIRRHLKNDQHIIRRTLFHTLDNFLDGEHEGNTIVSIAHINAMNSAAAAAAEKSTATSLISAIRTGATLDNITTTLLPNNNNIPSGASGVGAAGVSTTASPSVAPAASASSAATINAQIDSYSNYVADICASLSQLIAPQYIPQEQQRECMDMFSLLSKLLVAAPAATPSVAVLLPVQLVSCRPLELQHQHKPHLLESLAVQNSKKSLEQIRERLRAATAAAEESNREDINTSPVTTTTTTTIGAVVPKKSSALFYDPFAAKRARTAAAIRGQEPLLWSSGTVCRFVALFSNPLAVPIKITNVIPIIEVVDSAATTTSTSASTNGATTAAVGENGSVHPTRFYRLYNKQCTIPAYAVNHEVLLSMQPLVANTLFKLTGVKLFCNNAVHVIHINEEGLAIPSTKGEISKNGGYPYKAVEKKKSTPGASAVAGAVSSASSGGSLSSALASDHVGIATTDLRIVTAAPRFGLVPSWIGSTDLHTSTHIRSDHIRSQMTTTTTVSVPTDSGSSSNGSNGSSIHTVVGATTDHLDDGPQPVKLELYPGETRRERVSLCPLTSSSSVRDICDFRVTLSQYVVAQADGDDATFLVANGAASTGGKVNKGQSSVVLDFHGPLAGSTATTTAAVGKGVANCSLVGSDESNSLEFDFLFSSTTVAVEIEVEIVTTSELNVPLVAELNRHLVTLVAEESSTSTVVSSDNVSGTTATSATDATMMSTIVKVSDALLPFVDISSNNVSASTGTAASSSQPYTIYSRKYKLVTHLSPCAGLLVEPPRLASAAVAGTVHECRRVTADLQARSHACTDRISILSNNHPVVLKFVNATAHLVFVGNSRAAIVNSVECYQSNRDCTFVATQCLSASHIHSYNDDSDSLFTVNCADIIVDSVLLTVLPYSTLTLIVNYPFDTAASGGSRVLQSEEAYTLQWAMVDHQRIVSTSSSGDATALRFGMVSVGNAGSNTVLESSVNVSADSAGVLRLLQSRLPLAAATTLSLTLAGAPVLSIASDCSVPLVATSAVTAAARQLHRLPLCRFVDIQIVVSLLDQKHFCDAYFASVSAQDTLQLEFGVVIVPSINGVTSGGVAAAACAADKPYLLSGQLLRRCELNRTASSSSSAVILKIRVSFVQQGGYSLFTVVRCLSGKTASDWWTLPSPIRIVAM